MSLWLRWYTGATEDGKFRVVARNAGVTVRDAIAVWAFILEDAASEEHRGICTRLSAFIAPILDLEEAVADKIIESMCLVELISKEADFIRVTNWDKRQFETDTKDPTNAQRQKRWREKTKTKKKQDRNGTVTVETRPDTETETDNNTPKKRTSSKAEHPDFDQWYRTYPKREARGSAEKAYRSARQSADASTLLAGAEAASKKYANADPKFIPLPATWLNQKRWLDEPSRASPPPPQLSARERLYREGIV